MTNTIAGDWKVALPRLSSTTGRSVLPIVVGDSTFAIPLEKVRYVDYPDKLMPLPLATSPVEGLASFNNRPLVQISVAQTLNIKSKNNSGKIVVIDLAQGEVALRVDEVLGFVSSQPTAHNDSAGDRIDLDATTNNDIPLLNLEDILPWLKVSNKIVHVTPDTPIQKAPASANFTGHVLLVTSGTQVIALLANDVDRIEEIDAAITLRHPETDADGLIKIENHLFPSRSLARMLKCQGGLENYALIVHGTQQPWALLVERVLRLEQVDRLQAVISPAGTRSVWYLNDERKFIEVVDVKEFFGVTTNHEQLTTVTPQWHKTNLPKLSTALSIEGIRICCGNTICILPLTLVNRTVGNLGEVMTLHDELTGNDLVPIVDGTMLLEKHPKRGENCNILLSLCSEKHAVLSVDSASLQTTLSLGQWIPLAALPPPTSLLFDAAIYDEAKDRWILRVRNNLDAFLNVWATKRALVNAMLGWVKSDHLDENATH